MAEIPKNGLDRESVRRALQEKGFDEASVTQDGADTSLLNRMAQPYFRVCDQIEAKHGQTAHDMRRSSRRENPDS